MKSTKIKHATLAAVILILASCGKKDDTPYIVRPSTVESSPYISKILDYSPAPGQYTNETLGIPKTAETLVNSISNLVSLGAFGGSITFAFDHSVKDSAGADLAIYGNPNSLWSEPGIVMVSQDKNNNGLADDEWYELAGSEYDSAATIKNYTVTYYNHKDSNDVVWKDNLGNIGAVKVNAYHKHNYYPLFAKNQDSITFTGTLLPDHLNRASIITNPAFAWGYSDSYTIASTSIDNYALNKYNSFDISWARNMHGQKVSLAYVDFVKVYTGQLINAGILGEVSTEVKGAADLHILKK